MAFTLASAMDLLALFAVIRALLYVVPLTIVSWGFPPRRYAALKACLALGLAIAIASAAGAPDVVTRILALGLPTLLFGHVLELVDEQRSR